VVPNAGEEEVVAVVPTQEAEAGELPSDVAVRHPRILVEARTSISEVGPIDSGEHKRHIDQVSSRVRKDNRRSE